MNGRIRNEEWMEIKGWPGYDVSNYGRVRSRKKSVRMMKTRANSRGHLMVSLRGPNRSGRRFVGVMVLEAFTGPRPDGHYCCHRDGVLSNNRLANLSWEYGHGLDIGRGRVIQGDR